MTFKDLPEGQTHFYGDGCPEHNTATLNDLIAQEMARFDSFFKEGMPPMKIHNGGTMESWVEHPEIKSFLTSLAHTVARATAEKLDVEDVEEIDGRFARKGWNANNAERHRRERKWMGEDGI